MRSIKLAVASVATFALGGLAQAALLAEYTFGAAGPSTVAPNVTGSVVSPTNLDIFNVSSTSPSYAGGAANPFLATAPRNAVTTPALAYAGNHYWSVTFTPASGYFFDLDSLDFLSWKGGTSSNRGFAIYSNLDGFTTPLFSILDEPGLRATPTSRSVTLPAAFDYVTTPVTFRFYIHSVNNATTVEFDNLRLIGEVALIPEPAALSALVLPALALLRRR